MRIVKTFFVLATSIVACAGIENGWAEDCGSLRKVNLPTTQITVAQLVPAGKFTPPKGEAIEVRTAFCRVAAVSSPTSDSQIDFEVWLPATHWNGKFQGIGNGGFAGYIEYRELADAVAHGYAAASTNTGHYADGTDATWALHHPEKIIDFGYRAIHVTNVNARVLIKAFYGSAPKRAYFSACSNGGRQALMEAQRFPDDYDGIIAGAPANYWTHLLSNSAWDDEVLLKDSATYIPPTKLPGIQNAALAACDANDGVKDGVIEDPPHCHFDTAVLLCRGPETEACLTQPQLDVLNKLYSGAHTTAGEQIFPGYSPGGEAAPDGWQPWITGTAPGKSLLYAFSTQFFKNMVFDDPGWDFHTFNLERDTMAADNKRAHDLNANDPDLSRFKARGGKLILYHGWSDAAIAPTATVNYYDAVVRKLGAAETNQFVRLFMAPGMQHCAGGAGPDRFGQNEVASGDPQHNIGAALEQWVEGGPAPSQIIAQKRARDGTVTRTRPLCAYPAIAHYSGSGSTDAAENFTCSAESARDEVQELFDDQTAAWNRGDLAGFMRGYEDSPELTFFSGDTIYRGWQATLARYQKRYQSEGREMGQLTFTDAEIEMFGADGAVYTGRWHLSMRNGQKLEGLTTVICKRTKDGWKIVHDHSS